MPIRLYPDPEAEGRVGIPRKDGELFEREDAERLIGQGIATRSKPERARKSEPAEPAEPEKGEAE
jgi:hypothetical protein